MQLADGNISALDFDGAGRLWVGYFDRGLDVMDRDRVAHFEDDTLFCVNRIVNGGSGGAVVATANGLAMFDAQPSLRRVMRREQGLLADHVTDVLFAGKRMIVATPAGVTIVDDSGTQSVSAFHGLVNPHVYALAQDGDRLLVGTLGGLSVLQSGIVRASYTTINSRLPHNWITAIQPADGDWLVGTYGAGVLRLTRNGEWDAFQDLKAPVVINPNAMLVTSTRVYAGTMENGLAVFNRAEGRWHFMTDGLPSLNVTAVALGAGDIYIGTDNGLVRTAEQNLR
jgi:ligand-binding sensor domain-containing protein